MLCNFIALKRAIKFFVSLVDPFFVDCIVLDRDTTHYSTGKFQVSGHGDCYDQSVFDRVFNINFQSKLSIYCKGFLKHVTSFGG